MPKELSLLEEEEEVAGDDACAPEVVVADEDDVGEVVPVVVAVVAVVVCDVDAPAVAVTLASARVSLVESVVQQSSAEQHHLESTTADPLAHLITHSPPDGFSMEKGVSQRPRWGRSSSTLVVPSLSIVLFFSLLPFFPFSFLSSSRRPLPSSSSIPRTRRRVFFYSPATQKSTHSRAAHDLSVHVPRMNWSWFG